MGAIRSTILFILLLLSWAGPIHADSNDDFGIASSAPRRFALVIGVSDYDGNNVIGPSLPDAPFVDLPKACGDATEIAKKLVSIGWKAQTATSTGEVKLVCNPDNELLHREMDAFREKVDAAMGQSSDIDLANVQFILYFSGHAVEIGGYTYLFANKARPNLVRAVQAATRSGPPADHFPLSAYDLYRNFYFKLGDVSVPLTVILDACRENPLPDKLTKMFLQNGKTAPRLSIPTTSGASGSGANRLFSTSPTRTAYDDGDGERSYFAAALLKEMRADARIWDAFAAVKRNVRKKTEEVYGVEKRQEPDIDPGDINPCFYKCKTESAEEAGDIKISMDRRTERVSLASFNAQPKFVQFLATDPTTTITPNVRQKVLPKDWSLDGEIPKGDRLTLFDRSVDGNRKSLGPAIDIFYCQGADEAQVARQRLAWKVAFSLLSDIRRKQKAGRDPGISRLTFRTMSEALNSTSGNRYNGIQAMVENAEEQNVVTRVNSLNVANFERRVLGSKFRRTPDYVSFFVCKVEPRDAEQPFNHEQQIYLQVSAGLKSSVQLIWEQLLQNMPRSRQVDIEEVSPDRLPDYTTVKYYHTEDRDSAFAVAKMLDDRRRFNEHLMGDEAIQTIVIPLTSSVKRPKKGNIEVWLGKSDILK